jgi:hypothetical protein
MHALFKRQVERKMAPVTGLFSLRIPEFESDQLGILNRAEILPQLHVRHTAAQT